MVALLSKLGLVGHEPSFPLGSPGPHALVSLPACLQACRESNRQHPVVFNNCLRHTGWPRVGASLPACRIPTTTVKPAACAAWAHRLRPLPMSAPQVNDVWHSCANLLAAMVPPGGPMLSLCHLELCQTQWTYLRNSRACLLASQGSPQAPPLGSAWPYGATLSLLHSRSAGHIARCSPQSVPLVFAGCPLCISSSSSVTSPHMAC